ncbi:hydroxymethylbilane synthase [Pseudalkalibacillus caeni]|uniref:Porphobilinogen deaminase n=1 Tax=Exobacillus caeni TaxID=2574798 RepID=A0A5R9FAJ4_9BACL|nr:hydroxymethylbilane synthase [Pseudalkalibacillus caeni]TLS39216.1 hydroxymethylbilane synthase [Pseudalkalibacillus caeni]
MRKIVIGSRRSNLALTQTKWVISQLEKLNLPFTFEIKEFVTKGDRILDVTLSKVGGKGLFVKEIEQAMLDGEIDMAVHSMKDMPSVLPEGLTIGCIPEREDHRDAIIAKGYDSFEELPEGAVVGTSSLRRQAQIQAARPDLKVKWIRGNIDTRLRKLDEEDYDAIVLAAAGLHRMGWSKDVVTEYLPLDVCLSAVGQGALGIECRESDKELLDLLSRLNDDYTNRTVMAERAFLHSLEGGCQVPIAGYAEEREGTLMLTGLVGEPDGSRIIKESLKGDDPVELGKTLANNLKDRGAKELLDRVKDELDQ